ncbi:MAG: RraA family protein [Alphaproteobacteria bacterium]|nr:RraA family protein [Alphaproteobacteria bacterium]
MAYQRYVPAYATLDEAVLTAWRRIPTAVASDCMNRTQSMAAAIKPVAPGMRLCAQARTVVAMAADGGIVQVALTLARRGEAIVMDAGGVLDTAVWGGIATAAARALGIAGIVIDGAVRDLADIRADGLPTFARAVVPRGPHDGFGGIIDSAIAAGGVPVRPGDLVLGDDDGVVVVPLERAAEVLRKAEAHLEKEQGWLRAIAAGKTVPDLFGMPQPEVIGR